MDQPQTIKFGKEEYVVIPKGEYIRLQRLAGIPEGSVDALEYASTVIARTLKAAREAGGLTQVELAQKLGKSQPLIGGAENGTINVGERYVASVLKACGLPGDWGPSKAAKAKRTKKAS
jgi:ribosome-binding protein aMBF1 (putative translation factor)